MTCYRPLRHCGYALNCIFTIFLILPRKNHLLLLQYALRQNKGLNLPEGMDALNATLKQGALDLQWSSLEPPSLALAQQLRLAEQALKTAEIWSELDHWEAADAALGRCLALSSCLATAATSSASTADEVQQERAAVVLFSSLLLRLRASLRLGQEVRVVFFHSFC